ncbi:MAG: 16S rRNA (cytidine(1402)-2'-O)-methyltransferase [Candidatus Omnitrophica bacterium]|nr:16S rRNA (cytidine(1402)-2'-O)-methyltransferase [Candidatus Omnitrophota bacterium]
MKGNLYIVSTPIGNLEDITFRAVETLKKVDLIACEDTRRTKVLLDHYGITTHCTSYHSYSSGGKKDRLADRILEGQNIALVSDSGTPGISDPGTPLIRTCIENEINIISIPGACACIAALTVSGKDTSAFIFEGFLSNKGAKRKNQLTKLLEEKRTVILYESPHRIEKFLEDLAALEPEREIIVARELTKKFEEILRGKAEEIKEHFKQSKPRGEFTVIF